MLRIIIGIGALQVAVTLVNLLRSKMVAVMLGPEGVGAIGVVDQLVQLVLYISTLSLPFAAVRFLSRAHSEGPEAFSRSFSSFLRALLALTTVGALIGGAVALVRPDILGHDLLVYGAYLLPALISIPAMALQGLFSNVLAAGRRTRAAALMALVIAAALTSATAVGIYLAGVRGMYWAILAANVLLAVSTAVYLRRSFGLRFFTRNHGVRQELRKNPDILVFALSFYAGSLAYSFAFFVARLGVLTNFGEAEAGRLQVGIALYTSLNLVLSPANGLYLTPILNRRLPLAGKFHAALEFQRKQWIVILLLAMGLMLFSHWAVVILFSPAFLAVAALVALFVLAQAIYQVAGVFQSLIIGLDDLRTYGILAVIGHAATAAVAWVLAPRLGILGIGVAFLVSSIVHVTLTYTRLHFRFGMRMQRRLIVAAVYGVLALAAGGLVNATLDPWQPLTIGLRIVIYVAFTASLLAFLDASEVRQLVVRGQSLLFPSGTGHMPRLGGITYRRVTQRFFPEVW